jgi:3-phenylpropionate/trans-cinnamate dioxygenase ferredoxin reductase component
MTDPIVIVGGGQAAAQAVQTLRQAQFDGPITLIGGERHLPYQRPPLSKKYLANELTAERLYLRPETFYVSRKVDVVVGVRVEEIEADKRRIRLNDGRVLGYGSLLVATGSRVRRLAIPGAALAGIHYVRTIDDVDAIKRSLGPGTRIVIVGAGYIGLEVAAVTRALGNEVTVVEAADRIMARVVCPEVAAFFAGRHAQAGVDIRCATQVTEFIGTDRVSAVATASGERFECDIAIVGIGIMPAVEIAERAGLPCADGIRVDSCARTPDRHITAAGDCTNHPHPLVGRSIRLESVHNAVEQAKSAALSLLGQERPFADVPWFWSDQYEIKLQIAGLALEYDEVVIRGDPQTASFAAYYLAADRPVAVDAINSPRDFAIGKKLVTAQRKVSAASLADSSVDLASLVA